MPSLYELTDNYISLYESADIDTDSDGAIDSDDAWLEIIKDLEVDIESKLTGCVKVYQSLKADELEMEYKRLRERAKTIGARAEKLKEYMKENVEKLGEKKMEVGVFILTVCNNSQPSVEVYDISQVPDVYDKVHEREIDKKLVLESHKIGLEVPGCHIERGTHLRIR
jgi:hypothetical protein